MDTIPVQQVQPQAAHHRLMKLVARFIKAEDGATAIEFAAIATPFLGLLFVTLQIALVLWVTQVLESAVATASRQLYTGQFQTTAANVGQTAAVLQGRFKTLVCANLGSLVDCSGISVDVRTFTGVASATVPTPVTNGVYDTSTYTFQSPARNDIVVVRASLQFPNYASAFGRATTLANGQQLIMATAAFRAEPF